LSTGCLAALQGLSYQPYLAAHDGDVLFALSVRPTGVTFRVMVPGAGLRVLAPVRGEGRRQVRAFSARSRRRLMERASDLGESHRAEVMVTLTMPGEWESVCASGRAFKRHVQAMRKRLVRHLDGLGVLAWGALWWLEFQVRGAPHLHIVLWGPELAALDMDAFRVWASEAWSEVVGHQDPHEREKHLAAGTRVERMRRSDFGYATKYASKMRQKAVPAGFQGVGRFWGTWRHVNPAPITWHQSLALIDVARVVGRLAALAPSDTFRQRLAERFARVAFNGTSFAATVYGTAAVEGVLGGSVWRRAEDPLLGSGAVSEVVPVGTDGSGGERSL
jgi:hypothetical protein